VTKKKGKKKHRGRKVNQGTTALREKLSTTVNPLECGQNRKADVTGGRGGNGERNEEGEGIPDPYISFMRRGREHRGGGKALLRQIEHEPLETRNIRGGVKLNRPNFSRDPKKPSSF